MNDKDTPARSGISGRWLVIGLILASLALAATLLLGNRPLLDKPAPESSFGPPADRPLDR